MKITKTITTEFEFDYDAEVKRLEDNFQGAQLQRQLSILNHFKNGDYVAMHDDYDSLPYDDDEGCPEQEFTGQWYNVLFYGGNEYNTRHSNRFRLTSINMNLTMGDISKDHNIFGDKKS